MHQPPVPDTRTLLPPILSCLPTAFLSPRPPPALLPLLSPILRQRISLMADTATSYPDTTSTNSRRQNWLQLLSWSPTRAERLVEAVGELQLEPHPISGELELFGPAEEESITPTYRRIDEETLHAKSDIKLYSISVIWQWCEADSGGTGIEALGGLFASGASTADSSAVAVEDAWRVAEIRTMDISDDPAIALERWSASISEAQSTYEDAILSGPQPQQAPSKNPASVQLEEDDGYWAQYDATPGASRSNSTAPAQPASSSRQRQPPSPVPQRQLHTPPTNASSINAKVDPQTELDYYTRYDDALRRNPSSSALPTRSHPSVSSQPTPPASKEPSDSGVAMPEDAAYWSRYDATPGPSRRASTQNVTQIRRSASHRQSSSASPAPAADADDYWSRYADVQPALDSHDPDEEVAAKGVESSLGAGTPPSRSTPSWGRKSSAMSLRGVPAPVKEEDEGQEEMISRRLDELAAGTSSSLHPYALQYGDNEVHSPSPSRPGSSEGSVAALEEAAEREAAVMEARMLGDRGVVGDTTTAAQLSSSTSPRHAPLPSLGRKMSAGGGVVENGIKQHISSEIKSLFMLSQKVGIERSEFERLVRRELAVLGRIEL